MKYYETYISSQNRFIIRKKLQHDRSDRYRLRHTG